MLSIRLTPLKDIIVNFASTKLYIAQKLDSDAYSCHHRVEIVMVHVRDEFFAQSLDEPRSADIFSKRNITWFTTWNQMKYVKWRKKHSIKCENSVDHIE